MQLGERSAKFKSALHDGLTLEGTNVRLEPLALAHHDELVCATKDGELWNLKVTDVPQPSEMSAYIAEALAQRQKSSQLPFVVRRLADGKVVGCTRFYFVEPRFRNLSIGYTWYSESVHRTAVNSETKLLLLTHAFERAGAISVQWHVYHGNLKSQAAVRRLGAKLEGVLRNDKILSDGRVRHTHCFGMLDTEWPQAKANLVRRIESHQGNKIP